MINELDEMTGPVLEKGKDVNVIAKQLTPKIGGGSLLFEIIIWFLPIPLIFGLIYLLCKVKAQQYLDQLQQRVQGAASTIDNYLEQRVVILDNLAALIEKSAKLDHDTLTEIAALRSGGKVSPSGDDNTRNEVQTTLDKMGTSINVCFEKYPELRSQEMFAAAIKENSYLQKEITAARENYNDTVNLWNQSIYIWPTKRIIAARNKLTTRIPFVASGEIKAAARSNFFK